MSRKPFYEQEDWPARRAQARQWFADLQNRICTAFETLEEELTGTHHADLPAGRFEQKPWNRPQSNDPNPSGSILNGGGTMAIMRGRVFEKVGVNISTVYGRFAPEFAQKIPGADQSNGTFWAAGISSVAHMRSPRVPAVHLNTRMIVTSKGWFGGGTDLTPMQPDKENKDIFHQGLKECCDRHTVADYQEYKEWCDRYFYLPHRDEPRGDGGIFYDYLDSGSWKADFAFTQDVGKSFLDIYPAIVRRTMNEEWAEDEREEQLVKRGRYVEYNLLYDRGTQFGLKTGGNSEAILMSLPPEVKWP